MAHVSIKSIMARTKMSFEDVRKLLKARGVEVKKNSKYSSYDLEKVFDENGKVRSESTPLIKTR